ncbi:MAG: HAMP domain-containing histidine kinase [Planctomycetia bacterium]|nr:HAMP domain-containing histidine kinase [Planctomycetia bacterium]
MRLRARLVVAVAGTAALLVTGWWFVSSRQRDARLDDALLEFAVATLDAGGRARCEADPGRFVVFVPGPGAMPGPLGRGPFRRFDDPARRPDDPPRRPDDGAPRGPRPRDDGAPPRGPGGPQPAGPDVGGPAGQGPVGPPLPGGPRPDDARPGRPREGDGTWLWAYDATFVSHNTAAPPLPPALVDALAGGARIAAADYHVGDRAGRQVALRTTAPDGPCAVVLVRRLRPQDAGDLSTLWVGALALALGVLGAVWLAAGTVVRRLRRLEQHVGRAAPGADSAEAVVAGDDEVTSVARAFDRAGGAIRAHLATVEARERTLRDFVGNTTHDVGTPLTVLQAHLATLRDQADEGRPADGERVKRALEEAHYVGMLLHNLGAIARLEAGEVHLDRHRVDLGAVLRRAVDRHAPIARGRGIALEHAVPEAAVEVLGDVTLLEQAVSNVVHNAVSYADHNVAVVLETSGTPPTGFRLRVLDDGPGIPPDEVARVTERAYRGATGRTRRPGGGGLGLAIVKDVLDRHGFALTLAPVEPRGLEVGLAGRLAPPADARA